MRMPLTLCLFFLSSLLLFLTGGCAGSGHVGGSSGWDTYNEPYPEMVSIVERAINSRALGINNSQEIEPDSIMRITFSRTVRFQDQDIQEEQADVYIRKMTDTSSVVKIENPDYYFAVPENQRTDYKRILRNSIKMVMKDRD